MDALTALVNTLNLHAKLVYAGGVCGRWLMEHNSEQSVWFHLVSKGQVWVYSPSWQAPLALNTGDIILFLPHAAKHFLSYSAKELPADEENTCLTSWTDGETGFVFIAPKIKDFITAIRRALDATGGNRTKAAKHLGISERTLRNKLNAKRILDE